MSKNVTRRALVTGGVFAAAGALLGATGCSSGQTDLSSTGDGAEGGESTRSYPTNVYETDVLVIGSGYAGCYAAMRAMQLGSQVAIMDKAVYSHSGTSGYNWGSMYTSYDMSTDPEASYQSHLMGKIRAGSGVSDQNITNAVVGEMFAMRPTITMENLGAFHERLEDGTPGTCCMGTPMTSETSTLCSGMYGKFLCHKVKRMGADIHDRVMLLNILTGDDGAIAGAVGLNLVDGTIEVFRAKSVVMATGSYNWLCGWTGWRPQSMVGPESTGDGYSIMLQNGVPIGNMEFVNTDYDAWNPGCLRDTFTLGLEYPNCEYGVNANGEHFALEYLTEHPDQGGIETLTQLVAGEVYHGRGSESGGVWLDTTEWAAKNWEGQELELFYRPSVAALKRNFGYEFPERVEVVADHWCSNCTPTVSESMETVLPGLFFAGMPTMSPDCTGIMASGSLAGYGSATRAASADRPTINWDQVNAIIDHTYDLLEREEGGLTPTQVMLNIQMAYHDGIDLLRNEEGLAAALGELKRIRREDLPAMTVADKSPVFNLEWRHALEAEHMLNCATGAAMAALERRESRFHHVRTDYPELNNSEEYLRRYMINLNGDEFTLTTEDVDMSIVPMEYMDQLIACTNINSREA